MNVFKKTLLQTGGVIVFLLLVVFIGSIFVKDEPSSKYVRVRVKDSYLDLEVADNSITRGIGLSNRESIEEDRGMIFIYDYEFADLTFWMKDTLISLDMIFVNEKLEVVDIIENVPICEEDPCEQYSTEEKAMYVIEVNAGWVLKNSVEVGDRVDFIAQDLSGS